MRNTGRRPIHSSVYNHNFHLAEVRGNQIVFRNTLSGKDRVYLAIAGFGLDPKDYDIRIENRKAGAGLRITADRPLSRAALWSVRAPLPVEPFIDMKIEPGAKFTWRINYDFYKLPTSGN